MKALFAIFVTTFTFVTSQGFAQSPYSDQEITIAYANQWAPISYDDHGIAKGLLPERVETILGKRLGMKVRHLPVPWGRAQFLVETGQVDAFVTTITPKRLTYALASKSKIFLLPFVPVVRSYDAKVQKLKNPDDLSLYQGELFCDVLGNGWADYFYKDKPVEIYTAPSIKECLKLLRAHRVEAIIHARPVVKKYINELGLHKELSLLNIPSEKSPNFSFLLSKKSSFDQAFLDYFDQTIYRLEGNGN